MIVECPLFKIFGKRFLNNDFRINWSDMVVGGATKWMENHGIASEKGLM
jgi:hypothetical protein